METMKPLKDLTLLDRFLFSEAMEDSKIMETILEIILGREVLLRYLPQAEKEQKHSPLFRYIRLDVWGEDLSGNVYDVEVQKKDTKNLSRRSRFYHSIIDGKMLKPGDMDFNHLKDSYVIIITPFDPFGEGKYQYTFRMNCQESSIDLNDGAVRIFLNTHGQNSEDIRPELAELLEFMEHTNRQPENGYDSRKVRELQKRIEAIKSSEETGVKYMQAWEERELDRQEAHAAGRQEGMQLKLKELIVKKMMKGKNSQEIADDLEEDLETIQSLIEEIHNENQQK